MVLSAIITISLVAQTGPAGDREMAQTVRRYLRQLGDIDSSVREAAERNLIELGPPALDFFPDGSVLLPTEVRARLDRVQAMLQKTLARKAAATSRLSFNGTYKLSDVLSQIELQTGNRIVDYRDRLGQQAQNTDVTLVMSNAPFWLAVQQLLDQANLSLYGFSGEANALAIVNRHGPAANRGHVCWDGAVRVEATRVQSIRDLRIADNSSLAVTLEVTWEPRILPIAMHHSFDSVQALDQAGNEITVRAPLARREIPLQPTTGSVQLAIPFVLPSRESRSIKLLAGDLEIVVPGAISEFQFGELEDARDVEQRHAGVTVRLSSVRRVRELFEIQLVVTFDEAAGALESHRDWIFKNEAYLVDRQGARLEHVALETTRQTESDVGLSYKYFLSKGTIGDYTLTYKTPSALFSMSASFRLENLDLP